MANKKVYTGADAALLHDLSDKAREILREWIPVSELRRSDRLSEDLGTETHLKLENLLPTGSFKVRPATFGIHYKLEDAKKKGVLASSSGNFAHSVAYAAQRAGVRAEIVMMASSSEKKKNLARQFGAQLLETHTYEERESVLAERARETGALVLHPNGSAETIAADATLGLELLEQIKGPFRVFVPVSGGGLLAGVALAVKQLRPACQVIGVQPMNNGSLNESLSMGEVTSVAKVETVADSLIATRPSSLAFAIIRETVNKVIEVTDGEILAELERFKQRGEFPVEAGGIASVAGLRRFLRLDAKRKRRAKQMINIAIVSGGNGPA